jgi:hypothetical protein
VIDGLTFLRYYYLGVALPWESVPENFFELLQMETPLPTSPECTECKSSNVEYIDHNKLIEHWKCKDCFEPFMLERTVNV